MRASFFGRVCYLSLSHVIAHASALRSVGRACASIPGLRCWLVGWSVCFVMCRSFTESVPDCLYMPAPSPTVGCFGLMVLLLCCFVGMFVCWRCCGCVVGWLVGCLLGCLCGWLVGCCWFGCLLVVAFWRFDYSFA